MGNVDLFYRFNADVLALFRQNIRLKETCIGLLLNVC